eukprot:4119106-Prymnesium_polylepis.3
MQLALGPVHRSVATLAASRSSYHPAQHCRGPAATERYFRSSTPCRPPAAVGSCRRHTSQPLPAIPRAAAAVPDLHGRQSRTAPVDHPRYCPTQKHTPVA